MTVWQTGTVPHVLYVYAIARAGHSLPAEVEAVDGSAHLDAVDDGALTVFYTPSTWTTSPRASSTLAPRTWNGSAPSVTATSR